MMGCGGLGWGLRVDYQLNVLVDEVRGKTKLFKILN